MYEKDKSMTKEEEVFEAFRHCISDPGCGRCPRKSDDCSKGIGHFEYVEKRLALDVVEMLKDALKKQIPKKAGKVKLPCRCGRVRSRTSDGYGEYYGKVVITCPGCGEIVTGDTEEEAIENWNRRNRKDED